MPEDEADEKPPVPEDDFGRMVSMMSDAGISSDQQLALYLGDKLRDAGVGQVEGSTLDKLTERMESLPQSMPLSRAAADETLSREIGRGGLEDEMEIRTQRILNNMMPYIMAMNIMQMFAGGSKSERTDLEQKMLDYTVKNVMGERSQGSDEMISEIKRLRRSAEGKGGLGKSEISRMAEASEELRKGVKAFKDSAQAFGMTDESQGDLEKIKEMSGDIRGIVDDIRGTAKETPKPKKKSVRRPPKKESKKIPVRESEEEEPETPPRDKKGRFKKEEESEEE